MVSPEGEEHMVSFRAFTWLKVIIRCVGASIIFIIDVDTLCVNVQIITVDINRFFFCSF
jgi:hypothetical protein